MHRDSETDSLLRQATTLSYRLNNLQQVTEANYFVGWLDKLFGLFKPCLLLILI